MVEDKKSILLKDLTSVSDGLDDPEGKGATPLSIPQSQGLCYRAA